MKHRTQRMRMLLLGSHASSATAQGDAGAGASSMHSTVMDSTGKGRSALRSAVERTLVRRFLNVTSVLSCKDGLVCIAVSCARKGARNAGKEVRNIYVAPQDLKLSDNEKQWDEAVSYIFI